MKRFIPLLALLLAALIFSGPTPAQRAKGKKTPTEGDYYRMISFPLPDDVVLEVGGLDFLDKKKTHLLACTRRGELWQIDNVYVDSPTLAGKRLEKKDKGGKLVEVDPDAANVVGFKRLLAGLHEPLGVLVLEDGIYMAQRGELTRVKDTKGTGRIDLVEACG
jgi:hypothetical protein